jgi:hypothetical protein
MKPIQRLLMIATVLSATGNSWAAAILAVGGVYGGPSQKYAFCTVTNQGPTDVTWTYSDSNGVSAHIVDQAGQEMADIIDHKRQPSCIPYLPGYPTNRLLAGDTCLLASVVAPNSSYGCALGFDEGKAHVVGTLDLRDANYNVLISVPLR